ncbi:MAG: Rod shape-determining protein RodA, partial [uncultured Sphingosinicella sp.]
DHSVDGPKERRAPSLEAALHRARHRPVRRDVPVLGRRRVADALGAPALRALLRAALHGAWHVVRAAGDVSRTVLARLWLRDPAAGRHPLDRHDRWRRQELARTGRDPHPALRADEACIDPSAGRLLRLASSRRNPQVQCDLATVCDARHPGRPHHPATRPRDHLAAALCRDHRDVPGGAAFMVFHRRRPRRGRGDSARLQSPDAAAPAEARADLPDAGTGSARRRLPHHPVQDRDRFGRHLRQGLPQRNPEPPPLPARAAYRLHLPGHGRGMGAGRRPLPDRLLLPSFPLGNERCGGSQGALQSPHCGWHDDDHLLLLRDQPFDGGGPGARRRHSAAAFLLWRIGHADGDDLPWHPDVDRPRESPQPPPL